MMKQKTILIWGAWYGSRNVGDQALLLSIADLLNEAIPDLRLVVITADPDRVTAYTLRDSAVNILAISPRKHLTQMIAEFSRADYLVFGGGVPFYDDVAHSIATFTLILLAFLFNVQIALWCVSSQVVKTKFAKLILRLLVLKTSVFTCRDRHTQTLLLECGANPGKLEIVADPVFSIKLPLEDQPALKIIRRAAQGQFEQNQRELVALTPRLIRGMDGEAHTHYSPKNKAEGEKELDVYAAVVDWLWSSGYQPIFVPMNTVLPDDDRAAAKLIISRAKFGSQCWLVDEEVAPLLAAGIYTKCRAGLVSRVHGSINAFLSGCPVVMYAFDKKHRGIMEQMGSAAYVFDPEDHQSQHAIDQLNDILQNTPREKSRMALKLRELQDSSRTPARLMLAKK